MDVSYPPAKVLPNAPACTLGDLLFAVTPTPVAEADWIAVVRCIAAGDQHALHALYERTYRLVFTVTLRITGDRATAEEVTLDVFHCVWQRARMYDPAGGSVVGWIMNQARSRAIDRVRFEHRKKRVNPFTNSLLTTPDARDPSELLELKEQGRLLRDAMAVLTSVERQAIETAFFSELTYVEAATRLNQPPGTIKTRIRSSLEKLRQALARTGKQP